MAASIFHLATSASQSSAEPAQQKIRPAGVAGSFYPADPLKLASMIDGMLAQAHPPAIQGHVLAVVAPHAGYPYSGPVAAYSYSLLKGRKFARVVVIAPSHYEAFRFSSVYDGDGYATPLGTIPVDKAFAQKLAKMSGDIRLSEIGHAAIPGRAEHALEVQLPWLQRTVGDFSLVPIIMGDQSYASSRALGLALAKLIQDEKTGHAKKNTAESTEDTLIVASSDLSHYHPYDEATQMDHRTLDALQAWDYVNMSRNFDARIWEACGGGPIIAAVIAAERLGADQAKLLRYANSGDTSGDRSRVVGYGAVALVKTQEQPGVEEPFSLNLQEREQLLNLARKSVESAVVQHESYEPSGITENSLKQERGAFVTLREAGSLRGCIGYTSAVKPLYLTVRDAAMLAALSDPRFRPVSAQELPLLQYEISVLSPLRRVQDVKQIRVGLHGLLIKNTGREGLLLPQVATEQHWDRTTFLEQTCEKAGMAHDCWKEAGTDIFVFTAVVFGDHPASAAQ